MAVCNDCCVQFELQTREERMDQEDNCIQAESQERSATPSSNTHSGWASSHYSPSGAKLHLPHILTTTQSSFSHPHDYANSIKNDKVWDAVKSQEVEVRGRWTLGGFPPMNEMSTPGFVQLPRAPADTSPVQQPWPLRLVRHEKTCSVWLVTRLCFLSN